MPTANIPTTFRGRLAAAPLKHELGEPDSELTESFRGRLAAAPLKRGWHKGLGLPVLSFRGRLAAAPLKRNNEMSYSYQCGHFPRPFGRGPIEASP